MSTTPSSSRQPGPAPSLSDLIRPPVRRGMTELDCTAFEVSYPLLSIRIDPAKIATIRNHPLLKGYMVDLPKAKHIVADPSDPSLKLLRLRVQQEDQLPRDTLELIRSETKGLAPDTLELDYDYWSASEVLNSILPLDGGDDLAPSSFTQTGHIGHVNLRPEWLPYKTLIGQIFLDKNPQLRTIVNKLDNIHAEYRYFDMEVLAGEREFITTTNESGCTFTFDFSKVYWNSRLQHEHDRIIAVLQPGEVVADVMAGVGPFAVPAAKKGCYVLGNDLNPEGVKWMEENRVRNKVEATLRVTELDGREFIRQSARSAWDAPFPKWVPPPTRQELREARRLRETQKQSNESTPTHTTTNDPQATTEIPREPQLVQHYIMNLPDSALTFLDAFQGVFSPLVSEDGFEERLRGVGLPMIHVYCFTRELEYPQAEADICQRTSSSLSHPVSPSLDDFNLHLVRRVAPNKDMYCLSFRLPREVALASRPEA